MKSNFIRFRRQLYQLSTISKKQFRDLNFLLVNATFEQCINCIVFKFFIGNSLHYMNDVITDTTINIASIIILLLLLLSLALLFIILLLLSLFTDIDITVIIIILMMKMKVIVIIIINIVFSYDYCFNYSYHCVFRNLYHYFSCDYFFIFFPTNILSHFILSL